MSKPSEHWDFEAIGTHWQILTATPIGADLKTIISERIENYDRSYSRFRNDGLVSEIRQRAGTYELPEDAKPMMDFYEQLYSCTRGGVSPLVGRTLERLGYDANYTLEQGRADIVPSWDRAITYKWPKLFVKQADIVLDFGAAGKGNLVDIVSNILLSHGHETFVVNAGGIYTSLGLDKELS